MCRPDKDVESATTAQQVAAMYEAQTRRARLEGEQPAATEAVAAEGQ